MDAEQLLGVVGAVIMIGMLLVAGSLVMIALNETADWISDVIKEWRSRRGRRSQHGNNSMRK